MITTSLPAISSIFTVPRIDVAYPRTGLLHQIERLARCDAFLDVHQQNSAVRVSATKKAVLFRHYRCQDADSFHMPPLRTSMKQHGALRQPKPCRLVGKMLRGADAHRREPASGVRFRAVPRFTERGSPAATANSDLAPLIPNSHSDTLAG